MKLTLILAGSKTSCLSTKEIWQQVCNDLNVQLEVFKLNDTKGQEISKQLNLASFPALIINEKVIAVGHPTKQTAKKIISNLKIN